VEPTEHPKIVENRAQGILSPLAAIFTTFPIGKTSVKMNDLLVFTT